MLLQFSVSNFRCLRGLQTLNFAASALDRTLPENSVALELPGVAPVRWLKAAAIYGPNASGKTTVIQALKAFSELVTQSAKTTDPQDLIPQIEPFALDPAAKKTPTAFEVMLAIGGLRYGYRLAATRDRIWHESLRLFPTAKAQTWFSRDWNPNSQTYEWAPERPADFHRDTRLESDTLSNMLFLSKLIASNRTEAEPVFRWFKQFWKSLYFEPESPTGWRLTLKLLREQSSLSRQILQLLKHADLGITGAKSIENPPPELLEILEMRKLMPKDLQRSPEPWLKELYFIPQLTHSGSSGADIPLRWHAESAGTHRLFALIGPWLETLAEGRLVCIDELDASMHPLLVMELLRLLFSEKENPKGAQIIFTTHNPLLLETTLMRRDQVWFTEKNKEGEASLYPLSDYSPRKGESLVRGYLSGRYGGVPFIPNGILGQAQGYETLQTLREDPPEPIRESTDE